MGVADKNNTFAHVFFEQACKKKGIRPIFGVRLDVCDLIEGARSAGKSYTAKTEVILLAKDDAGLKEIYEITSFAWDNFYYFPRVTTGAILRLSKSVLVIAYTVPQVLENLCARVDSVGLAVGYNPSPNLAEKPAVAIQNNRYPNVDDKETYQLLAGARKHGRGYTYLFNDQTYPQHYLSDEEFQNELGHTGRAYESIWNSYKAAGVCNAKIDRAEMVKYPGTASIHQMCLTGAIHKGVDLDDPAYDERLYYELKLIEDKGYVDYFLIVADMTRYAKQSMLVGPSRGSSAGSLVCYLLGITEIDPLKFGLLFERFIDINRHDLPDIDIDFPDKKREKVTKYLSHKYGHKNVRCLANVNRLKPKSAIGEFAQALGIPKYETEDLKNAIIERSGGDARAAMCITDTFDSTDVGRDFLKIHPQMALVSKVENHASHAGRHAAGILVSTEPLTNYASTNNRDDVVMLDKKTAEVLGLLKIDCLGLRTLTLLEETMDQIGMSYADLYNLELDDDKTYKLFNSGRFNGIFQFEGQALQLLAKQMGVRRFDDIVAITALARPGPLHSGGAGRFVKRRTGEADIEYISNDPVYIKHTEETLGIIIYQEQLMYIGREYGGLSWEDVSDLRRAASKSLGAEFFNQYKNKFLEGAEERDRGREEAEEVWENMVTFGSWGFNKCLSGDTKVVLASPGTYYKKETTIKDLYVHYKAFPKPYVKTRMNKGIGPRLISLYPDDRCRPQYACNIIYNGEKEVIAYTFSNGIIIKCTPDHKFIINGIWKPIGFASEGDEFLIGEYEKTKRESTKHLQGSGNINNKIDNKGESNPGYINGMSMHLYEQQDIARLSNTKCEDCGHKHNRMEVHHNDFNNGYNRPFDTSILCPGCHKKRHYNNGRIKQWGKGYTTNVINLVKIGESTIEETFDIELPEHHNYLIEGGLITHNSHAVSYGLISYWTAYMKANYPMEFAVATLNNSATPETAIKFLRDLVVNEGYEYLPVDPDTSQIEWSVQDGKLVGGLVNIEGIGEAKAKQILKAREGKKKMTPGLMKKLMNPVTKFDIIFPTQHYWGQLYDDPRSYGLINPPDKISTIDEPGIYTVIGRLIMRDLRDLNDYNEVMKRGGKVYEDHTHYLRLLIEDDTSQILCVISRWDFEEMNGQHIAETAIEGETWFLVKGKKRGDWQKLDVNEILNLSEWSKENGEVKEKAS